MRDERFLIPIGNFSLKVEYLREGAEAQARRRAGGDLRSTARIPVGISAPSSGAAPIKSYSDFGYRERVNKLWHAGHVLGKGASQTERIAWHRAHQLKCACRPVPESLRGLLGSPAVKPSGKASSGALLAPLERAFARLAARFAADAQVSTGGKGFGARALKVDGKIFALMSSKHEFVVKLPRERVAELVSAGRGSYFDAGKGKPMKEWLAVDLPPARWFVLAREARLFVSSR